MRVQDAGRVFYQEFPDAMATAGNHFYSRFASTDVHTRNLPHWAANNVLIFVTYRPADSVPTNQRRAWQVERDEWLRLHPAPWDEKTSSEYHELFSAKLDAKLDAGYGKCVLLREDCRKIVVDNILRFDLEKYRLHAFVVMPNHVHVLIELKEKTGLSKVLHNWKSYTAKRIKEVIGAKGGVWQREYYDSLIRDSAHYDQTLRYIRKNAEIAERIYAQSKDSRTGCQSVLNARAARCTGDSRTGGSLVTVNAPSARSTDAAHCTMDDDSRTRSLRIYDTEITSMLKTI